MGISIVSLANRGSRKPSKVPETLVVRATLGVDGHEVDLES